MAQYGAPMADWTAEESARRMRAMWGYSLMEQRAFFRAIKIKQDRGSNISRNRNPVKATEDELRAAAEVSGLPVNFALWGTQAIMEEEPGSPERLAVLEARMRVMQDELREVRERLADADETRQMLTRLRGQVEQLQADQVERDTAERPPPAHGHSAGTEPVADDPPGEGQAQ